MSGRGFTVNKDWDNPVEHAMPAEARVPAEVRLGAVVVRPATVLAPMAGVTDTVFRRSFSALCLAVLAERDLKTPFLGADRYRTLLDNALNYSQHEQDLRGFDPVKGWIHPTAHTADLLLFLAKNPFFTVVDQHRLLQAISQRLASANLIYTYGEQGRLAVAAVAVISRPDFDAAYFQSWLATLDATDGNVWKSTPPDDHLLKTFQNNNYLLESLAARLYAEPKSPAITAALDQVTQILSKR